MPNTTPPRPRPIHATPPTHTLATGQDVVTLLHRIRDWPDRPGWAIYMVVANDPVYLAGEFRLIHEGDPDLRPIVSDFKPGLFAADAA